MGQAIQVLLVDDNAIVRDLLLQAISPLASVEAFSNATEALRRVQQQTPDLIISDYRMPGLSGLELLVKLRIAYPQLAVVMMASRADIGGPLAGSSPLVEEFIEKPFFTEDAVTRIKRVLDRIALAKAAREGADSTSVRGTLAQMSVIDLLQTLDIGRKTCRLVLIHASQRSEMQFHEGQLIHATLGSISGEEAIYEAVAWTEGSFLIDFEHRECPRTITHSTQSVLLEALRRFDEAQRDCDVPDKPPAQSCGQVLATAMGF